MTTSSGPIFGYQGRRRRSSGSLLRRSRVLSDGPGRREPTWTSTSGCSERHKIGGELHPLLSSQGNGLSAFATPRRGARRHHPARASFWYGCREVTTTPTYCAGRVSPARSVDRTPLRYLLALPPPRREHPFGVTSFDKVHDTPRRTFGIPAGCHSVVISSRGYPADADSRARSPSGATTR